MSLTDTPYARLTQLLYEHRAALTGTDVRARLAALEVLHAVVHVELQEAREVVQAPGGKA